MSSTVSCCDIADTYHLYMSFRRIMSRPCFFCSRAATIDQGMNDRLLASLKRDACGSTVLLCRHNFRSHCPSSSRQHASPGPPEMPKSYQLHDTTRNVEHHYWPTELGTEESPERSGEKVLQEKQDMHPSRKCSGLARLSNSDRLMNRPLEKEDSRK